MGEGIRARLVVAYLVLVGLTLVLVYGALYWILRSSGLLRPDGPGGFALALLVIGGGLLAALLVLPLAGPLIGRLVLPLLAVTQAAESIAAGNLNSRVEPEGPTELAQVGRALNRMASTLEGQVAALADSRDRLDAVLAAMPQGVVFVEGDGRVTYVNQAARSLLGTGALPANSGAAPHHVAVLRNYALSEALDRCIASHQPDSLALDLTLPRRASLAVTISPLRQGGQGVVMVLHDVTQERRVEQMRRDFVANVSHELKTPVTAVQGFAETLLEGALEEPASARSFVEIIHSEAGRMAELIGDLLELARLEAEPDAVKPEPIALAALLPPVLDRLVPRARQAGVELIVRELPPLVVRADMRRIDQVLVNLVENSLAHTPAGGRITVTAEAQPGEVRVAVVDTGQGIAAEAIPRIFERFYRADKGRSRKQGGTGLGLAIVKHIVEDHGGQVGAASEQGRGTTVWFTLPLAAA